MGSGCVSANCFRSSRRGSGCNGTPGARRGINRERILRGFWQECGKVVWDLIGGESCFVSLQIGKSRMIFDLYDFI